MTSNVALSLIFITTNALFFIEPSSPQYYWGTLQQQFQTKFVVEPPEELRTDEQEISQRHDI